MLYYPICQAGAIVGKHSALFLTLSVVYNGVSRWIFPCLDQEASKGQQDHCTSDHQEQDFQLRFLLVDKLDTDATQCIVRRMKGQRRPDAPGLDR